MKKSAFKKRINSIRIGEKGEFFLAFFVDFCYNIRKEKFEGIRLCLKLR